MRLTATQDTILKAAFTDQPQDFFLVYVIILLTRQMDQLEKQIIDIQIHALSIHSHLTHFFIKLFYCFPDLHVVILFNGGKKLIQPLFA